MAAPTPVRRDWSRPWPLLAAGFALCGLSAMLSRGTELPGPVPMAILAPGLLLAGAAVQLRLRREDWSWPRRAESAAVVSGAGLAALLSWAAMRSDWVSGHMFFTFLFLLCVAGAVLILL